MIIFFDLPKFFQFFVVAPPISEFLKFLKKVEFLHDHEELDIGNWYRYFQWAILFP